MSCRAPRPLPEREMVQIQLHRSLLPLLVACLVQGSVAASARDFRAADTQAEDYPTVQALAFMDQLVATKSGGRHRIRVFHSRQLGEEKETIEQTRVGAIDLNRTNVAPIGGGGSPRQHFLRSLPSPLVCRPS